MKNQHGVSLLSVFTLALSVMFIAGAWAQSEPAFLPNESLVTDNLPAVPLSIVEKARKYREFRAADLQSWHPLKREMLISTRFGSTAQIHEVKMPGGARTQLTFLPDRVTAASYQPKKGSYFLFTHDTGGGEWFQFSRYDVATGEIMLLTDGKSRNSINSWSKDGNWIAYTSTRRNRRDTDLYIMNPADPKTDRILLQLEGGGWLASSWSPDGKQLLLIEFISANKSRLWLVDIGSGNKKLLTSEGNDEVSYRSAVFSADGKGFYTSTDKDNEFHRLTYVDLATGKHTCLTTDIPWDIDSFTMTVDGRKIAFEVNEAGLSNVYILNLLSGKRRLVKLPVGQLGSMEWHANGRELGLSLSTTRSSSDVYSYDLLAGKFTRWTFSETGGLKTDDFPAPQLVKWNSFDGLEISGFLYMPPPKFAGKRPVIVNIHGGPEGQSRPGFLGTSNYYLNEMGVAIIFPNVRGSTGYGKSYLKADNGMNRDKTHKDIGALLDWIKANPKLDGERIMITGGSYGGYMTLAVATEYNDKIRCSKAVVAPSNLVTFLQNTENYRRDLRRAEYGDERDSKMREYLEKTAPLSHVKSITKPMFVVAGKNDPRVPVSESDQMTKALKDNGAAVWYLVGKNEGHGFQRKENQDFEFYATVMFIQNQLLN